MPDREPPTWTWDGQPVHVGFDASLREPSWVVNAADPSARVAQALDPSMLETGRFRSQADAQRHILSLLKKTDFSEIEQRMVNMGRAIRNLGTSMEVFAKTFQDVNRAAGKVANFALMYGLENLEDHIAPNTFWKHILAEDTMQEPELAFGTPGFLTQVAEWNY